MKKGFLRAFNAYDLILIAMLCALTVAFKSIVKILVSLAAGAVGIPGGAIAGGLYMFWMPLAIGVTGKRGAALLMTLIQCIVVFITAAPGSHGIWTFATYMFPALVTEIVFFFESAENRGNKYNIIHFMAACALANMTGTIGSNLLFFRLSLPILMFSLTAAAFSGALGGILGYLIYKRVKATGLTKRLEAYDIKSEYSAEKDGQDDTPFDKMESE